MTPGAGGVFAAVFASSSGIFAGFELRCRFAAGSISSFAAGSLPVRSRASLPVPSFAGFESDPAQKIQTNNRATIDKPILCT